PPSKGGDRPLLVDGRPSATATAFAFSPDGRELALFSTQKQPGEAAGDLYRMPRSGGLPRLAATRVIDWRWGAGGDLLCLARYGLRARAGTLTAIGPGGTAREIAAKVQSFSVFGRRLLYVVQAPQKGDFKLELWGIDLAAPRGEPHRLDEGVYGWALSPDGATLYYKARCAGGSRSCSLLRAPFSGGAPELLAANVAGFDLSRDGMRILVQQPHRGAPRAVDVAVISAAGSPMDRPKPLAEEVDPTSRFAAHLARVERASAHTERAYVSDLRQLAAFLDERGISLDAATRDDLRAFLASRYSANTPATLARKQSSLRAFYEHRVRMGHIAD